MKRVLTIQDISCIGKCSLTVALPIISAFGIETAIVPTAVLSTHTQFSNFTFRDLTDDLAPIMEHWKKEGFTFDAIYTGYLGSERQVDLVKDYIHTFGQEDTLVIVDPAMADNGKLYTGFDTHFAKKMSTLCGEAQIILPNISEAAFMLGEPYPGEEASPEELKKYLLALCELGAQTSVITGVNLTPDTFGFLGYHKETKEFFSYGTPKVPYKTHGTGDVFASAFTGAYTLKHNAFDALKTAADYTYACIKNTYEDPHHVNYAVNFEAELPNLIRSMSSSY